MITCILCDTIEDVQKRLIVPRHRDDHEGLSAKPICERCHDQYHWKPSRAAHRGPGYGFRVVSGCLVPVSEQLETIHRIIELRHTGCSWSSIADTLNYEMRPTARGGDWYAQTVIAIYQRECPDNADAPAHQPPGLAKSRYGWTSADGELIPHRREQEVIRWMVQRRAEGATFTGIAEALNLSDVPAKRGGVWYPASVSNVLRREGV